MKMNVFVKPDEQRELVHSVVARKGRTKSKKLLVIALALMPSLSISVMAQPSGNDPEVIPVKPLPTPTNPGPRIVPDEPTDIPIVPFPDSGIPAPRSSNSATSPHCYFLDGVVYIDADVTVTAITATITRYDDNQVWSDASNTNTLSITTSTDPGSYLLELTLSNGQSYKGKYIIE